MPPAKRRTTSTKASETPRGADPEPAATTTQGEPTRQERPASSAKAVPEETEPATVRLRLPFLTVSLSRPPVHPADSAAGPGHPPATEAVSASSSFSLQRLMFYGGVAALGVAGAVDWPVAAAIAAGTYIATRTRSTGQAPSA